MSRRYTAAMDSTGASEQATWWVACLCAAWCDSCVAYRAGFEALAGEFPQAELVWLDTEDNAEEISIL